MELIIDRSGNFVPAADVLAGADAIIGLCSVATMNNATADLLWLQNYFVGMDGCADLPEAQIEGRVFSNSKRLSGPAIAEHSIAMLLSLATRSDPPTNRAQAMDSRWDRSRAAGQAVSGSCKGKTLLVVGPGRDRHGDRAGAPPAWACASLAIAQFVAGGPGLSSRTWDCPRSSHTLAGRGGRGGQRTAADQPGPRACSTRPSSTTVKRGSLSSSASAGAPAR